MFREKHYAAVGLFVLLVTGLAVYFLYWLSDNNEETATVKYLVYFQGGVNGLSGGSSVRFLGVKVGQVQDIRLNPDRADSVEVVLSVAAATPITDKTVASVQVQGLTGLAYIGLKQEAPGGQPLETSDKSPAEIATAPSTLEKLFENVPDAVDDVSSVTRRLNQLLSDQNVAVVGRILANTEAATAEMTPLMQEMRTAVADLQLAIVEVKSAAENLDSSTTYLRPKVAETFQRVNASSEYMRQVARRMEQLIANNEEPLNKFIVEGLGELQALLRESRATVVEIRGLAENLKQDPSRIIMQPNVKKVEISR